jgi:hypothetical protein
MTFQQDMEKKCEGTFSHSATSIPLSGNMDFFSLNPNPGGMPA